MRAIVLSLLGSLFACAPSRPAPLRIGTNPWFGNEPLHALATTGELSPRLRLVEYVSATQVQRAFENGDIDGAAITLDEAIRLSAATQDVTLAAQVDWSVGGDALVARRERPTLRSLVGARIGVENTALGALMLSRALERGGLEPAQVVVVPLNANEHLQAWLGDQVDAVITYEPMLTQLAAHGGVTLFSSAEIPGEVVDVIVARTSVLRATPAWLPLIRAETLRARDRAVGDPARFLRDSSRRLKLSEDEVSRQLEKVHLPDAAESTVAMRDQLPVRAREIARLLRERRLAAVTEEDADRLFAPIPGAP